LMSGSAWYSSALAFARLAMKSISPSINARSDASSCAYSSRLESGSEVGSDMSMTPPSSCAIERKRQHLVDVLRIDCAHHQAIEAERDAGAIRQPAFQRGKEVLVHGNDGQSTSLALAQVLLEPRPLFLRVSELMKAVR